MWELGPAANELHARSGQEARASGFERLYALGEHSRAAVMAFGGGGEHFETLETLAATLDHALRNSGEPPLVLVKGSRGMRMERVVAALAAPGEFSREPGGHD